MKKNGFIATSLIYSFFLVFIAILAALLNDYIANKTILERYNEEALDSLNSNLYDVSFVVYGAEARTESHRGQTLTNLIQNSNFIDNSWWDIEGSLNFEATNFSKTAAKLTNVDKNSYLYQNVQIFDNKQYYISMEYAQAFSSPIQVFVNSSYPLLTQDTSLIWNKTSRIFSSDERGTQIPLKLGLGAMPYNELYLTNIMLINLTDHFGSGNEPTSRWMDENITYFSGTMSFLKEESISGENELNLKMYTTDPSFRNAEVTCVSRNSRWISTSDNTVLVYNEEESGYSGTLSLSGVNDDIDCAVRWTL